MLFFLRPRDRFTTEPATPIFHRFSFHYNIIVLPGIRRTILPSCASRLRRCARATAFQSRCRSSSPAIVPPTLPRFRRRHPGPRLIEIRLIPHCPEKACSLALHNRGFIAATKQVSKKFVPAIETGGEGALKPFQARHRVRVGGLHDQMKVIEHLAAGAHLPTGFLSGLRQDVGEERPVPVALESGFAPVTAVQDLTNRAIIFEAEAFGS